MKIGHRGLAMNYIIYNARRNQSYSLPIDVAPLELDALVFKERFISPKFKIATAD